MRFRLILAAGAATTLALPLAANAGSPPAPYLVTGGGQVLASSDSSSEMGPGDTIAFVAGLDDSDAVFGSLQVVNTSEARGGQKPSIIYNGRVTCVEPGDTETTARFGGVVRASDGEQANFTVDVTDTGDEARGTDEVIFQFSDEPCQDGAQALENTTLARGNVKVDTANSGSGE
jgi:hypothetical protein